MIHHPTYVICPFGDDCLCGHDGEPAHHNTLEEAGYRAREHRAMMREGDPSHAAKIWFSIHAELRLYDDPRSIKYEWDAGVIDTHDRILPGVTPQVDPVNGELMSVTFCGEIVWMPVGIR